MINKEQRASKSEVGRAVETQNDETSGTSAMVHQAAEQVRSATVQRAGSIRKAADETKERAADRVRKLGSAVRKIGEHMRVEEQEYIADKAMYASQRLESVADYIAAAQPAKLLHDAQGIARSKPALIVGGSFALGLLAGRFLKTPANAEPSPALADRQPAEQLGGVIVAGTPKEPPASRNDRPAAGKEATFPR